ANERDVVFDPLVPSSLSFFDFGPPPEGGVSYNNLFFPNGSPIDCTTFPFTGTVLDVFGLAFSVAGGYTVNLWGDGDLHGPGTTTYGIKVIHGSGLIANHFDGVNVTAATVPVPGSFALLGVGLLGMLALRRRSDAPVEAAVS
ncbi:MAG: PEP-CTERM sorting domain-containing protein, partial [Gammaproteobacteria bacterium]